MRKASLMLLILLLPMLPVMSKCANRILHFEGRIEASSSNSFRVVVHVKPDANRSQPEILIENGRFDGEVYFDSTKSEGRVRDDCSRAPETVEFILLRNGQEVDRVVRDISKDFVIDKLHDYRLRAPLVFHVQ